MGQWPSAELKAPAPGKGRVGDAAWWLLLAIATVAILGGVWRSTDQYLHPTGFDTIGLSLTNRRECVRVTPSGHFARAAWPSSIDDIRGGCIVRVGATDVGLTTPRGLVSRLLNGAAGTEVEVVLLQETGAPATVKFRRVTKGGWFDLALLLIDTFVAVLYVGAALLLRLRRPKDPVARRMSLAFLMIAHLCNGPVAFWTVTGLPFELLGLAGFLLMTVTLPAYPNGVYLPRASRWVRVVVPAIAVSLPVLAIAGIQVLDWVVKGTLIIVVMGVAALVVRYRRMPAGREKQQVKWAVFGLSTGLLLIVASAQIPKPAALAAASPDLFQWFTATTTLLNQLGYGLIPAGILVSLLQYRLNDADAAAGKSLGYAIVTIVVGVVWAIVQSVVSDLTKRWSGDPMATTAITTAIAALFFTPARSYVLSWTEAKFQPALVRLRKFPDKLVRWQAGHTPEELAQATLTDLVQGVGAAYAAVLGDDGREWRVLAAHAIEPEKAAIALEAERPADRREDPFPIRVELADQLDKPDILAIGPRSDGASFTRDERSAIALIVEPLSNALQAAALRERQVRAMGESLARVEGRLARLEQKLSLSGRSA